MKSIFEFTGKKILNVVENVGSITSFINKSLITLFSTPLNFRNTFVQMEVFGVESLPVVLTTALFTGMVLTVQSYYGFKIFNATSYVGAVVGLSMTRELGPVLTSLIVTGRVGASMAAELGSMRVTEQIDAMETLAVNPFKYLVVPRLVASLIMMPLLTIIANAIAIIGGAATGQLSFGLNFNAFINKIIETLTLNDLYSGLIKSIFFGGIIALIGCYKGFTTTGGAEGVGRSTTNSVVISSMLILISDYYLTIILY
ncbi:ABC transporter permease [Candidatus Desantisbacteria bacterium]|nr:ABC transporter permease [Candidatus Desantisbacteria bacterium]